LTAVPAYERVILERGCAVAYRGRPLAGRQGRTGRRNAGRHRVTDLVALDGSNQAAVTFETDDLDALKAMIESMPPEVAAQAESHGVIPPFTVYVER
jgi:hypothetical protein